VPTGGFSHAYVSIPERQIENAATLPVQCSHDLIHLRWNESAVIEPTLVDEPD
jgi:hypothetical protein